MLPLRRWPSVGATAYFVMAGLVPATYVSAGSTNAVVHRLLCACCPSPLIVGT
jgi:hypothetical protein